MGVEGGRRGEREALRLEVESRGGSKSEAAFREEVNTHAVPRGAAQVASWDGAEFRRGGRVGEEASVAGGETRTAGVEIRTEGRAEGGTPEGRSVEGGVGRSVEAEGARADWRGRRVRRRLSRAGASQARA